MLGAVSGGAHPRPAGPPPSGVPPQRPQTAL
nr:MAG TPA: hypothetical protein [Caudoviricetes sp.]